MDDMQLVRLYAEQGSQDAFGTLVKRYIDLVYSSARRQVQDAELAEDVTQAVFIILTRKAGSLREGTILSAWLLMTTHYAAKNARRAQHRRRYHETRAAEMCTNVDGADEEADWEAVAPVIDEAIGRLGAKDRDALVLRYWEGKSLRDIGSVFGISENAAGKRVAHAISKLRSVLSDRGVASSLAGLGVLLAGHAVQAVPAELSQAMARIISGAGWSAQSRAIADGAARLMGGKVWLAAAGVVGMAMLGVGMLLVWQMPKAGAKLSAVASTQPAVVPATQPNWEAWVVRPGEGLGPIRLGMTAEQVRGLVGEPDRITGMAYEYVAKGFAIGFRREAEWRVATIMAGDGSGNGPLIKAFKPCTAEGVGMGSTFEQISAAYGEPEEARVDPLVKDGSVRRPVYRKRGIEFVVRGEHVVWLCIRTYNGGAMRGQ